MDNFDFQDQETEGEVLSGTFPLSQSPVDVQITVHVNNLVNTYPHAAIKEFKHLLYNPEYIGDSQLGALVIQQIIRYYGVNKMREWFELVFDWQFEKAG